MDSSQWRDVSHMGDSIILSDSEDEIPGSRDASDLEIASKLERGSISRTGRAHGSNSSKTIIDDTKSEEELEDEDEDEDSEEDIDRGSMNLIDKDVGTNQERNQDDSDVDEPIFRSRRMATKHLALKSHSSDEDSKNGEHISEESEDSDASENSSPSNDSDDNYNITGQSNDLESSADSQIRYKKERPKKFVIEEDSSDEESASRITRPGPMSFKEKQKVDKQNQKLENTEQHITLDDSANEIASTKDIQHSEEHISLEDSITEIASATDIEHPSVVELEDSIEDQSSSDHLPRQSNDLESSADSQIRYKKERPKKFVIEEDSSDEESASRITRPGPMSFKEKQKVDKQNQKLENTEQHITLDDSANEIASTKDIQHSEEHISLEDSITEIASATDIEHPSVVELEESIEDQSSSDHLPLSISDTSAVEVAISLAKEESPLNNPLLLQQRALDAFKLEQLQKDLMKAKTIYKTANPDLLPDRGEKLRQSIESMKKDVQRLSHQLEQTVSGPLHLKSGSPAVNIKTEPPRLSPQQQIRADFEAALFVKSEKEMGKQAQATFEREQALTVERLNHLQQSLNRCPEEDYWAEDPRGLRTKLMPHQKHALAWMSWREKEKPPGGLLADDMGLGKTLTMISLVVATKDQSYSDSDSDDDDDERFYSSKRQGRPRGGTLVICPASLLDQWQNEVDNRVRRGVLTVEVYHGARREAVAKRLAKNDMVITTYQLVASEFKRNSTLFKIRWKRIILDEAHIIRNHVGKISEAVCKLSAHSRWALTGTPIQNKEQDLYALLKFIRVTPFNDIQVWKRWVENKSQAGLRRLATVTKTLMLRRTKQELISKGTLEELPEKFTTLIDVNLDSEETKIYQSVLAFSQTLFAQFLAQRAEREHMQDLNAGKFDKPAYMAQIQASHFAAAQKQLLGRKGEDVKAHHILVLILRLRQICCHPGLIREMLNAEEAAQNGIVAEEEDVEKDLVAQVNNLALVENDENEDENEENLFSLKNPVFMFDRPSSKIKAVLNTVEDVLKKGEKMIIVSQWTGMLRIISSHLSAIQGASSELFTGNVPIKRRQGIVDRFNDPKDNLMILLLSLTAGGVGLNLIGGNHLLLIDIHWNPQLESQAQDRIYRFGQKRNVHIYKFLCNETIEQRVRQLQEKKLNLAEDVFTGHRRTSNKLSLDDLKNIFEM